MNQKLAELNATIEAKVADLGLSIVSGPEGSRILGGQSLIALAVPSVGVTNYQPRGVYLFAVAEGAQ